MLFISSRSYHFMLYVNVTLLYSVQCTGTPSAHLFDSLFLFIALGANFGMPFKSWLVWFANWMILQIYSDTVYCLQISPVHQLCNNMECWCNIIFCLWCRAETGFKNGKVLQDLWRIEPGRYLSSSEVAGGHHMDEKTKENWNFKEYS